MQDRRKKTSTTSVSYGIPKSFGSVGATVLYTAAAYFSPDYTSYRAVPIFCYFGAMMFAYDAYHDLNDEGYISSVANSFSSMWAKEDNGTIDNNEVVIGELATTNCVKIKSKFAA